MKTETVWVAVWRGDGSLKGLIPVVMPCQPRVIAELVQVMRQIELIGGYKPGTAPAVSMAAALTGPN